MSRVLHIIDTGGPGGAETVFAQISDGLNTAGIPGISIISREGWLAEKLRERGLEPVVLLPSDGRLAYLRGILDVVKRNHVTVIVAHLLGASFYASLAGRLAGVPVVTVFHGQKDLESSRLNWLKGRVLALPCGKTVFVSNALRDELRPQLGLAHTRCTVIHNGVDVKRFADRESTLRQRLAIPKDALIIGAVGNIRAPKAYDVLLHAAADVVKQDPRVVFLVAGEHRQPISEKLAALHEELRLGGQFQFLGLVNDIPDFLAGLDIFVISSRNEGFSIACVEAMSAGLPVVATRSGGPESIIEHTKTGNLVPAGNSDALAACILELIADPCSRSKLGSAGRIRAESHFSLAVTIDAYTRLVSDLEAP